MAIGLRVGQRTDRNGVAGTGAGPRACNRVATGGTQSHRARDHNGVNVHAGIGGQGKGTAGVDIRINDRGMNIAHTAAQLIDTDVVDRGPSTDRHGHAGVTAKA